MFRAIFFLPFLAFAASTIPASGQDGFKGVACDVEKYLPGQRIPEHVIRSWIPQFFVIDQPGGEHRFRGGPFSESNARVEEVTQNEQRIRYRMMVNAHDTKGKLISMRYDITYFFTNQTMAISGDPGTGFVNLGRARGTCKELS